MSELLTHEEYKAIADGLILASTAFVDGGFRKAASGGTFDSIDPATGKLSKSATRYPIAHPACIVGAASR